MKKRRAIICMFMPAILPAAFTSHGRPAPDDLEKVMRENMALEQRIGELQRQLAQLADSAEIGLRVLDEQRAARDESADRLNRLRESISRDSLNILRRNHEAATRRCETSTAELNLLGEEMSAVTEQYNRRVDQLQAAEALYGNDMLQLELEEAGNYLDRQYSTMEASRLNQLSEEAHRYSELPGFTAYVGKLNKVMDRFDLYNRAQRAINTKYDADEISAVREVLYPITRKVPGEPGSFSAQQYDEMNNLDKALSRYRVGITKLHGIIDEVNNDETVTAYRRLLQGGADFPTRDQENAYIRKVQNIVGDNGSHADEIERYFQTIPFLGDLFYRYRIEIIDRPVEWPASVELEIQNVIPLSLTR